VIVVRPLAPDDAERCDAIVAGLPQWFGVEEGIRQCRDAVRSQPGLVAQAAGGDVVGFLTVQDTEPNARDITWMAVDASRRRAGVGRALIDALRDGARADGIRRLDVKTLSDREDPGPEYAQTRAFYLAMGFVPVAELDIWGPDNPAQLLSLEL
jgi:GNAT superfamily N-acetyltransferase